MQSSAPAPQFNSQQVAQDQTKSNVNTAVSQAWLNNTNQVTPQGSLTYTPTGGNYDYEGNWVPQFTATQTLSPGQQAIYDKTTALQTGALDAAQGLLPALTRSLSTPLSAKSSEELRGQAYDALLARSRDELDRTRAAQETALANQGAAPGSVAYGRAMEGFDKALVDASQQATLNAGNLASQNLSLEQAIRNQPISDYQALLGFGGTPASPGFIPTTQTAIQPTDVSGPAMAQYQGQLNAYNQNRASGNALLGGLFGLGGSILGGIAGGPLGASAGSWLGRQFA